MVHSHALLVSCGVTHRLELTLLPHARSDDEIAMHATGKHGTSQAGSGRETTEDHDLPREIRELTGQRTCPIGATMKCPDR